MRSRGRVVESPRLARLTGHRPAATPLPLPADWIVPDWPVAPSVRGFVTTRSGGVSAASYATLDLGGGALATPGHGAAVAANRRRVARCLPAAPVWLRQVHGTEVVHVKRLPAAPPTADGAVTRVAGLPLAVLAADCLPVLLAERRGAVIGIAHAGWRGLASGVVERTLDAMGCAPTDVCAWLGPAIGAAAFEVGDDVRDDFMRRDAAAATAFAPVRPGKWRASLVTLARQRLAAAGVACVTGGTWCTATDSTRFFSYRRDGVTGRLGAFIYLDPEAAR